tara:strand:- start:2803 stop:3393 length:591 start_codon:yes stop_codon:yes gene_type:complete
MNTSLSQTNQAIDQFSKALEFLYFQGFRGRDFMRASEPGLRRLLMEKNFLPDFAFESDDSNYARHLIFRHPDDFFSIAAMVWKPGQGTPIHDHDGHWGILGMVSGELEVKNFFDKEAHTQKEFVYLSKMETYTPFAQTPNNVCSCADIHMVANRSTTISVSLHVYPKDIEECQVFEPTNLEENVYKIKKINLSYSE